MHNYSQFITYMMPCGMGYFLYDIFAMYQVYQSNQEASKGVEMSFKSYIYNNPLMFLHHILLSTFFIPIMINRRDHPGGDPMLGMNLLFVFYLVTYSFFFFFKIDGQL